MFGETFVEKRVVAVEQLQHAAVFAHHVVERHLGFALHRGAQRAIEFLGRPFAQFLQPIAQLLFFGRALTLGHGLARLKEFFGFFLALRAQLL